MRLRRERVKIHPHVKQAKNQLFVIQHNIDGATDVQERLELDQILIEQLTIVRLGELAKPVMDDVSDRILTVDRLASEQIYTRVK